MSTHSAKSASRPTASSKAILEATQPPSHEHAEPSQRLVSSSSRTRSVESPALAKDKGATVLTSTPTTDRQPVLLDTNNQKQHANKKLFMPKKPKQPIAQTAQAPKALPALSSLPSKEPRCKANATDSEATIGTESLGLSSKNRVPRVKNLKNGRGGKSISVRTLVTLGA